MTNDESRIPMEEIPADTKRRPHRGRWLWRSKWFWTLLLLVILLVFGTRRYEQLILQPPEDDWHAVALEDLLSERWYETTEGRRLSEELGHITDSRPMRFITGLYYQEYKKRYSPGYKNSQLIKVGPDQYPELSEMVTEACNTLGAIDGDGVPVPSVYLGWTGGRGMEITNFTSPSLVISHDFLWAFSPEELRYLIARQMGHIHCKHIYFLDVNKGARALLDSALPDLIGRMVLGGTGTMLLDWTKEAHITADRAGLLVTGDIDIACRALIKLNILANPEVYYSQPNPEAFAAQAKLLMNDRVTTAAAALAELRNPNPFLTVRVGDLLHFYAANSALFKDRTEFVKDNSGFDPGIIEDDQPNQGKEE